MVNIINYSFHKTNTPAPLRMRGCRGTKLREPVAPCAASQSDLRNPVALWPSRRIRPVVGSSAGSGSQSVQLVLQLVQDANHDLPEGLRLTVLLNPAEDTG